MLLYWELLSSNPSVYHHNGYGSQCIYLRFLEVVENDFVLNLFGTYSKWKTELQEFWK